MIAIRNTILAGMVALATLGASPAIAGTTVHADSAIAASGLPAARDVAIFRQPNGTDWSPFERGAFGLGLLALVVGAVLEIGRGNRRMDEGVDR